MNLWEIARAVYSIGLLVLGGVALAGLPGVLRVLRDLTAALTAAATSLRVSATTQQDLDRLLRLTERIAARVGVTPSEPPP